MGVLGLFLVVSLVSSAGEPVPTLDAIRALEEAGRDAEALAQADALVGLQPGWALARLEAARLRLRLGEGLTRAQFDLEAAQALAPENPRGHYLFGLLREEQGLDDQAIEAYRVALTYRSQYDEARFRLAGLLFAHGRFEEAEAEYRVLSKHQPEELTPKLQLAAVLERLGRLDEAEAILLTLWEADRPSIAVGRRLAALYDRTNQAEKARKIRAALDGPPAKKQHRPLKPSRR